MRSLGEGGPSPKHPPRPPPCFFLPPPPRRRPGAGGHPPRRTQPGADPRLGLPAVQRGLLQVQEALPGLQRRAGVLPVVLVLHLRPDAAAPHGEPVEQAEGLRQHVRDEQRWRDDGEPQGEGSQDGPQRVEAEHVGAEEPEEDGVFDGGPGGGVWRGGGAHEVEGERGRQPAHEEGVGEHAGRRGVLVNEAVVGADLQLEEAVVRGAARVGQEEQADHLGRELVVAHAPERPGGQGDLEPGR